MIKINHLYKNVTNLKGWFGLVGTSLATMDMMQLYSDAGNMVIVHFMFIIFDLLVTVSAKNSSNNL